MPSFAPLCGKGCMGEGMGEGMGKKRGEGVSS